jgi:calcium-dependent protein kinase
MEIVDSDNSGFIYYFEFLIATINREKFLSKEKLETVFKMFDKDGSGSNSIQELK